MKKKSADNVRTESEHVCRRLNQSLREQWARMDKAQKLAEELHEQVKEVEAHVEDGKKKMRRKS